MSFRLGRCPSALLVLFSIISGFVLEGGQPCNASDSVLSCKALVLRNTPASAEHLDSYPVPSEQLSVTKKSLKTLNQMGFDTVAVSDNWVISAIMEFCQKNPGGQILDVGAGYGSISRMALDRGMRVISNDISAGQLLFSRHKVALNDREKLFLNNQRFPELDIPPASIDAIVLHRVIHFLSGDEIERSLVKMKSWLKPGGKIFIVVMTPHHKGFSDWFLPEYKRRHQEGSKWPGEHLEVARALPAQAYGLPKELHVMEAEVLTKALQNHGYKVEKSDYISMARFGVETNRDGREALGVIAVFSD